jgi:hypothetical protein
MMFPRDPWGGDPPAMMSMAMVSDLLAVEAGRPFPERTWRHRPWRRGERATVLMRDGHEFLATVTHYSFEKGLKLELDTDPDAQLEWLDIADMKPLEAK